MRRVAIIFSHLGSGSGVVFDALTDHPRIDGFRTGLSYDHYDKIVELTSNHHKNENASAIWLDEVLHNYQFTCKPLLDHICPIFVLREPRGSLAAILADHPEYDAVRAARYYCYRLRGICEYACRCPNPFLVTESDLSGVESHLGIKGNVGKPRTLASGVPDVPATLLDECEACYERHLGHIRRTDT
jgi:hypothetical protein